MLLLFDHNKSNQLHFWFLFICVKYVQDFHQLLEKEATLLHFYTWREAESPTKATLGSGQCHVSVVLWRICIKFLGFGIPLSVWGNTVFWPCILFESLSVVSLLWAETTFDFRKQSFSAVTWIWKDVPSKDLNMFISSKWICMILYFILTEQLFTF